MADVLIRDIDPDMKRLIEERARRHARNLSDEVKALIRTGLDVPEPEPKMGDLLFNLVPPEYRVDLDWEIPDGPDEPPDFSRDPA